MNMPNELAIVAGNSERACYRRGAFSVAIAFQKSYILLNTYLIFDV